MRSVSKLKRFFGDCSLFKGRLNLVLIILGFLCMVYSLSSFKIDAFNKKEILLEPAEVELKNVEPGEFHEVEFCIFNPSTQIDIIGIAPSCDCATVLDNDGKEINFPLRLSSKKKYRFKVKLEIYNNEFKKRSILLEINYKKKGIRQQPIYAEIDCELKD